MSYRPEEWFRGAAPVATGREYLVKLRMPEGEASLMHCDDQGMTWNGMEVLAVEEITPQGWWRSLWNRADSAGCEGASSTDRRGGHWGAVDAPVLGSAK